MISSDYDASSNLDEMMVTVDENKLLFIIILHSGVRNNNTANCILSISVIMYCQLPHQNFYAHFTEKSPVTTSVEAASKSSSEVWEESQFD
jgi:hypothetical protein